LKEGIMRRGFLVRFAVVGALLALVAAACTNGGDEQAQGDQQQEAQNYLEAVQSRGTLRCGVNNTVPGFGFETAQGVIEGFDIDFCRAFAAAILGDPEAIELVPIDAEERFNALRAGEYDVLVRNTTWTSTRDGTEGISFAHVNFYDGQAMMVRAGEFGSIDEMNGTAICVTAGTTTELNLADYFAERGLDFEAVVFETNDEILPAFREGRCDGWTSDSSQLAGLKSQFESELGALEILPDVMSKEPLAPAVVDGQTDLYDVVNMVVNGVILAEELGIDSGNVERQARTPDSPGIATLLGVSFEAATETITADHGLGIENDFMQTVLTAVGNYGEIFDRHVGPDSPLGLERGLNALWTNGGLQYGIPFR
jgi:general L-amino acid transport system substrate-binding protein